MFGDFLTYATKTEVWNPLYSVDSVFLRFAGVGYATMTIVFFLDLYYCVIIAWGLFYLLSSALWFPELPWSSCGMWFYLDSLIAWKYFAANGRFLKE
ncbi:unnamed protein product [Nesidiocoris tenuis]|uniref:Uncharacterized protein n=1 Tax=Nesidiocoris tenuis TaxID=355587 RepID=A0A6H5HDI5_9HEMI|nr:unnamed protein product [Nesidiocoris tenuis]CAB0014554.1 unnamed protein product [Nesidiocoris tenuis]